MVLNPGYKFKSTHIKALSSEILNKLVQDKAQVRKQLGWRTASLALPLLVPLDCYVYLIFVNPDSLSPRLLYWAPEKGQTGIS